MPKQLKQQYGPNWCRWCQRHGEQRLFSAQHKCPYFHCPCPLCPQARQLKRPKPRLPLRAVAKKSKNVRKAQRAPEVIQSGALCVFCLNHNARILANREHSRHCRFAGSCDCLLCARARGPVYCAFCRIHNIEAYQKGQHKKFCKFRQNCNCKDCEGERRKEPDYIPRAENVEEAEQTDRNSSPSTSSSLDDCEMIVLDEVGGDSPRTLSQTPTNPCVNSNQPASSSLSPPLCPFCVNHNFNFPLHERHGRYCLFKDDNCTKCREVRRAAKLLKANGLASPMTVSGPSQTMAVDFKGGMKEPKTEPVEDKPTIADPNSTVQANTEGMTSILDPEGTAEAPSTFYAPSVEAVPALGAEDGVDTQPPSVSAEAVPAPSAEEGVDTQPPSVSAEAVPALGAEDGVDTQLPSVSAVSVPAPSPSAEDAVDTQPSSVSAEAVPAPSAEDGVDTQPPSVSAEAVPAPSAEDGVDTQPPSVSAEAVPAPSAEDGVDTQPPSVSAVSVPAPSPSAEDCPDTQPLLVSAEAVPAPSGEDGPASFAAEMSKPSGGLCTVGAVLSDHVRKSSTRLTAPLPDGAPEGASPIEETVERAQKPCLPCKKFDHAPEKTGNLKNTALGVKEIISSGVQSDPPPEEASSIEPIALGPPKASSSFEQSEFVSGEVSPAEGTAMGVQAACSSREQCDSVREETNPVEETRTADEPAVRGEEACSTGEPSSAPLPDSPCARARDAVPAGCPARPAAGTPVDAAPSSSADSDEATAAPARAPGEKPCAVVAPKPRLRPGGAGSPASADPAPSKGAVGALRGDHSPSAASEELPLDSLLAELANFGSIVNKALPTNLRSVSTDHPVDMVDLMKHPATPRRSSCFSTGLLSGKSSSSSQNTTATWSSSAGNRVIESSISTSVTSALLGDILTNSDQSVSGNSVEPSVHGRENVVGSAIRATGEESISNSGKKPNCATGDSSSSTLTVVTVNSAEVSSQVEEMCTETDAVTNDMSSLECHVCKKHGFPTKCQLRLHGYLCHEVDTESSVGNNYQCRKQLCSYESTNGMSMIDHEGNHMGLVPLSRLMYLFNAVSVVQNVKQSFVEQ